MRVSPWVLALLTGIVVPLAGFAVSAGFPAMAVVSTLLGAGAALALLLIPEMSVLLWAGASVVFSTGVLLFGALLRAAIPAFGELPFLFCVTAVSLFLGGQSAFILWRTKLPRILCGVTRGEFLFVAACIPILLSIIAVNARNGSVQLPDGREEFHARGFVNGDTMTLFALTNSQLTTHNSQLRRENPFAGNGPLEYPTLLHRALADLLTATGGDITRVAWWLIVPILAGTVAVSVLSTQFFLRRENVPLWSVLLLLVAFGSTWEAFTYPQSHTFLTGLFFLFILLLVLRDQSGRVVERRILRFVIGTLAIVLLFSNAVLGTAAVAIAVGSNLLQCFNRSWPLRDRLSGLVGSVILVTLFLLFPPGAGAIGALNVAYTAVPQFLVAALPALVVLWALWDTAWLHRSPSLLAAAVLLPVLGVVTLVFSGRDIVAENSPRFLFLLVLLGWPAVILVVQRAADWWWRQVRHVEHTVAEQVALWGGGAFTVLALLLPVAASVAGTLDVLVRDEPLVVSADELAAFAWIREHTPSDAVFLRAPESMFENLEISPLALPAFTGRAQVRSEYWLSPNDEILADVRHFFLGREVIPEGSTHLFCGPEISRCPLVGTLEFSSGAVTVRGLPEEH
ncbi:MAG: hypothetical protein Q8R32_02460 [bacterium]|nr:hypothetical protein [bacterium]